jgi:hypothetical protein
MRLLIILKFILILFLFVAGILFLLKGLGVTTPLITYNGAAAHDVPAGIVLVLTGVALAYFWKIRTSNVVTTETTESRDGETKTTKTVKIENQVIAFDYRDQDRGL